MDKIKVEPIYPTITPFLPIETVHLPANRQEAVEAADWWTLYYVDSGYVEVNCNQQNYYLKQGQGLLLQPGLHHTVASFPESGAAAIRLSFQAAGQEILSLRGKPLHFNRKCRRLLLETLEEVSRVESGREQLYAFEQAVQLSCEMLMIQLRRAYYAAETAHAADPEFQRHRGGEPNRASAGARSSSADSANIQLYKKLREYLEDRVYASISLDELVNEFHFSKTHLSETFKTHAGQTILTCYNEMKIKEAKRLIADTDMNFSQISNQLSFSSLHYFSRLFKKHTGMSPSEYAESKKQDGKGAV